MTDSPPPELTPSVIKNELKVLSNKQSTRLSQRMAAADGQTGKKGDKTSESTKPKTRKELEAERPPIDQSIIDEFVQLTQCPIYEMKKSEVLSVSRIMLTPAEVDPEKVCYRLPPACPEEGNYIFVVSLEHIDPDNLSSDELGKWGRPSGGRMYFIKTDDPDNPVKFVARDNEPPIWDYCLRKNKYNHPGTEEGKRFSKVTYLAYNQSQDLLGPYAVVAYEAMCHPNSLRHLSTEELRQKRGPPMRRPIQRAVLNQDDFDGIDLSRSSSRHNDVIVDGVVQQPRYTPRQMKSRPPEQKSTNRLDNMHYACLAAEKRKHETESEKLQVETEKLRVELQVMKNKKSKLDIEVAKMRAEVDPNVVIVDGMEYRHFEEAVTQ